MVLTDSEVGISSPVLSDADVGLALSDADVGLDTPKPEPAPLIEPSLNRPPPASPEELYVRNLQGAKSLGLNLHSEGPKTFWQNLTEPLKEIVPKLTGKTVAEAFDVISAYVSQNEEKIAALAEPSRQPTTTEKVIAGTQSAVGEAVDAFTSPLGIATLGIGTLPKAAQVGVSGLFAAHMASTLPGQTKLAVEAIKAGDAEGAAKHITGGTLTATFAGMAGKHFVKGSKEIIAERAKEVGPATEAALSGKESKPTASTPEPATVPPTTTTGETVKPAAAESPAAAEPSLPISTIQKGIKQTEPELVGMGGAVPAEFELSAKTPTGIKNSTVDQERIKRGLPAAMQPARRSFGAVWDSAMAKIDQDPAYADRLVAELRDKPRALTDIEDATLLHRQIELQNEYGKATRDLAQAFDDGRMEDVASEKLRVAALSDQLFDLYNIDKAAGTETGRGLNARKMMAYEDFSLAKMELEKRAAKNGEQLTDAERAQVVELNHKIEATQKAYDDYVARTESRIAALEVERALAQVERQSRAEPQLDPRARSLADRIVQSLEKQADDSRAYLRGKLFTISPDVLFHLSRIGAAAIARGALDFSRWSGAMIGEFGERIQPYLQEVFDASNKLLDKSVESVAGKQQAPRAKRAVTGADAAEQQRTLTDGIKEKIKANELDAITPLVQKLARLFVEQGVKERDPLIDAVHGVLKEIDPEITRRDAMDAISGYGKYKQLTKDEISVQLRDLKGQMQQVGKLEDIEARKPPLKTGVERRTPTDEERRLIKLVNEAKRKFGIVVTDPATQLTSALQARKTYYRNQISDLETQISSRQKLVKTKTPSPTDPELEALKVRRNELKEEFDEIFEKPGLTEEQREIRSIEFEKKRLEKRITEQERQLREGDVTPKGRPINRPANPELEPLKQRRDALNKRLAEARKKPEAQKAAEQMARKVEDLNKRIAAVEAKIAAGDLSPTTRVQVNRPLPPELESAKQRLEALNEQLSEMRDAAKPKKSQDEIALQTLKARLKRETAKLEDKMARGDFAKKEPRRIQLDPEAQRLHYEAAKVKTRWHEALMKDRLARRSLPAKIIGGVGETLNTVRAIMTSGELSGVLRQGGFIGIGNPARIAKAFPAMLRAFRSETQQHAVNMEIMARPNYPLYVRSKLYLAEHGQKLSQMEEAYMSRWAEKIPFVAGTQRAYSTFLNKLRADSFDAMSKTLVRRTGELTPERANAIANYINVATGRGNVAGKEAVLVGLNQYFFAPRWVMSRFQLVLGQPFIRGDKHTRRMIAEEYGKYLIGMGVIYGLWRMSGEEVETDPRSSDFGKLRVGETRVDLMAGLQQGTVLIGRLGSGETKRLSGKVVPIRGQDIPFGGDDSAQVIGRFLRTKMAPVPASAVDLLSGTDVTKRPVTPQSELLELSVPLTYRDIYKAMIEQGVPVGTALSLLAIFGAGVQTYDN